MIALSVVGADKVEANLATLVAELPTAIERGVARASVQVHAALKLQLSGTGTSDPFFGRRGAVSPLLGVRTGATRARLSPGGRVYRRGNDIFSAVGSPDAHVVAHDEGATITGNPYLRIPLAAAQTPAGQDRNVGHSVRGLPGLFVIKSRAGNLFLVRRVGKRGRLEFLYLLKRSVTLKPRHMFEVVAARMQPVVEASVGGQVSASVRRASG